MALCTRRHMPVTSLRYSFSPIECSRELGLTYESHNMRLMPTRLSHAFGHASLLRQMFSVPTSVTGRMGQCRGCRHAFHARDGGLQALYLVLQPIPLLPQCLQLCSHARARCLRHNIYHFIRAGYSALHPSTSCLCPADSSSIQRTSAVLCR